MLSKKSWALAITLVFFGGPTHQGGCPAHPSPELHPDSSVPTQQDYWPTLAARPVEGNGGVWLDGLGLAVGLLGEIHGGGTGFSSPGVY